MMTQKVWLKLYHDTGEMLEGESEMRIKWYPSGAKPRTYYAMGGTHYADSMYLQDAFTNLVNENQMTHHVHRLRPQAVRLKHGQHLKIYDFTSFTSRMAVQKTFMSRLCEFVRGYPFSYFDVRKGLVTEDFGDVLDRYTASCVVNPRLTYDRVSKKLKLWSTDTHPRQYTASMLGIFGNLMSCTFEHAAIMGQCIEDETQGGVAGDDGHLAEDEHNEHYIRCSACAIGVYEESKCFNTLEPPCISLKRPITQVPDSTILIAGQMPIPPSFHLLKRLLQPSLFDARYVSFDEPSRSQLVSMTGRALFRFLRSCYFQREMLSDQSLAYALGFANVITFAVRELDEKFDISTEGRLPACNPSHHYFWPTIAESVEEFRLHDPARSLVNRWYNGHITASIRGRVNNESRLRFIGDSCTSNSTKWISLMVTLGYIESDLARTVLFDMQGYLYLVRYLTDPEPIMYSFSVVKDIPAHLVIH
ncbi:hypothetical protein [Rhizoctonia solani ambivirus 2]|nr:hypothetical protein [Rhizoctonia solani ambivirus 2]